MGGLVALLLSHSLAAAQCAMCKNAITGSPDAARLSANFNFAVLVLLIPPVLIFCGIFVAVIKHRKVQGGGASDDDLSTPTGIDEFDPRTRGFSRGAKRPDMKLG
jgi:hypothetical protein